VTLNSCVIGYPEIILGRDLPAGESESRLEIPASLLKHRIPNRPSPEKSDYRKLMTYYPSAPGLLLTVPV